MAIGVRTADFPLLRLGSGQLSRPRGRTMTDDTAGLSARAAIERLFALHHGEIFAYLLRMLGDPELAADFTQDTFVKAYRAYDTLEDRAHARAWLYQIAHRVALDEMRRRRIVRFLPWTGESRGAVPSAEHEVMELRLSGEMQRALERIPERQRSALLLAELHDLTGLELAAALGVSHVAARALLTRARESLRRALEEERRAGRHPDARPAGGRPDARSGGGRLGARSGGGHPDSRGGGRESPVRREPAAGKPGNRR